MSLINRKIRFLLGFFQAVLLILKGQIRKAEQDHRQSHGILPVYFHNPDRKCFQKLIEWFIKKDYVFIALDKIEEEVKINDNRKKVWISFDDGWKENYTELLPVLKQYSIPATFFISVDCIEKRYFWFSYVRKQASSLTNAINEFWGMPNNERIIKVQQIIENSGKRPDIETFSIGQLKKLASCSQFSFGNHSLTHAILINCNEFELDHEIADSNKILEKYVGRKVDALAYPDGKYNESIIKYLKMHGFQYAFTTKPGLIIEASDNMILPRNSVPNYASFYENLCHAFGVWQLPINELKKLLNKNIKNY